MHIKYNDIIVIAIYIETVGIDVIIFKNFVKKFVIQFDIFINISCDEFLNKSIMDITDNYGIIHCTKEMFEKLKNKAMNYRKNKYDYEVLIDNKKEIKREYKDLTIDKASIDEMMYLLLRGEKE